MTTTVLIPVDGRHSSTTAEEYAVKLNQVLPLSVIILNVIDDRELDGHGLNPDFKETVLLSKRKYSEMAIAEVAETFKKAGMENQRKILTGDPAAIICQIAEKEEAAMVIMAESAAPELRNIGSITRKVLYQCRVPVLLLKHRR